MLSKTPMQITRYLKDWSEADDMPPIPNINIAIKNSMGKRRRESSVSKPESAEEAKKSDRHVRADSWW